MEEQATWRGHGFTFFVFTGIVFLCGIFFVLGMLVGVSRAQKNAGNGTEAKKDASSATKAAGDLGVFEDLRANVSPPLVVESDPAPEPPQDTPPVEPAAKEGDTSPPPPSPPPASVLNIQVEALGQSSKATQLVGDLKKLGFGKAFVVPPAPGDRNPLYRVQVGPFSDAAEADSAKQKLESAGYHPILKK